jgi:hypothetical protein
MVYRPGGNADFYLYADRLRWVDATHRDRNDRAAVNTGYRNDASNTCVNDRASVNDINNAGTAANSCSNTNADIHVDRNTDTHANAHSNTNADTFTNPDACSVYTYLIVVCVWGRDTGSA